MNRHKGFEWNNIKKKPEANSIKLWSLSKMEITNGEPYVAGYDKKPNEYVFCDCSAESPKGRRTICYYQ